jgi:hypothetical protein
LVLAAAGVQMADSAAVSADEWVQIAIRLEAGRFYSAAELHRQCQEKLPGSERSAPQGDSRVN